ncbi:MAG TPA: ribonuclease III [Candidatus Acidoferrales bacterium]|nr:ribonuclease III [Candidatus Acidoferrales bacterium]
MFFSPKKILGKFRGVRTDTFEAKRRHLRKKRELEKTLGVKIRNENYFSEALTHRSVLSIPSYEEKNSNERMEFLGDAILNFLVAEFLFNEFPEIDEGQMTRLRSLLVNQHALAEYASEINLSSFLSLSTSAQQAIDKGYETIVSDALEAVIAATYLDGGMKAAKRFVDKMVLPKKKQLSRQMFNALDRNFKSALLELAQSRGLGAPRYNVLKEEGPDHDRTFTVEVLVGDESCGVGTGKTKKAAEQSAAGEAYEKLKYGNQERDRLDPFSVREQK